MRIDTEELSNNNGNNQISKIKLALAKGATK